MTQGFDEMMALYQASVKKSPALMMENVQVDSNRGVTSRGNSPYDKFASPETRAKVLESRMQEIDAFAQSRKLSTAAVYAAAEAAMRTGKIPDLGQFGMDGDDSVATKQFLISNVLNLQGLEWTDYKGDPVVEDDINDEMREQKKRLRAQARGRKKTTGGFQMDDINAVADQIMSEGAQEGMRKATQVNTGEYGRSRGGRPDSGRIDVSKLGVGKTRSRREGRAEGEAGLAQRQAEKKERGEESIYIDPSRFMSEEGGPYSTGGAPQQASLSPSRMSDGGLALSKPQTYERHDLLPKEIMDKLKQAIGDRVHNLTRAEIFDIARERGLLGTEESMGEAAIGYDFVAADEANRKLDDKELHAAHKAAQSKALNTPNSDPMQTHHYDHASALHDEIRRRAKPKGPTPVKGWPHSHLSDEELHAAHKASVDNTMSMDNQDPRRGDSTDRSSDLQQEINRRAKSGRRGKKVESFDKNLEDQRFLGPRPGSVGEQIQEHDYQEIAKKHGGKFLRYIPGNVGVYEFQSEDAAHKFAGFYTSKTTATPKVDGKRVFVKETAVGESTHSEDQEPLAEFVAPLLRAGVSAAKVAAKSPVVRAAAAEVGSNLLKRAGSAIAGLSGQKAVQPALGEDHEKMTRTAIRLAELSQEKLSDSDESIDAEIRRHTGHRTESDKILGIMPGDPRAETWPKLSDEMRDLLNLESCGVFRGPRGFSIPEPTPIAPISEATVAGGMGGFIGAGMGGVAARSPACSSYELPDDPEERVKALKKMLSAGGLKSPQSVKEDETTSRDDQTQTSEQATPPVMRDPAYNTHPSRFMK